MIKCSPFHVNVHERKTSSIEPRAKSISFFIFPLESVNTGVFISKEVLRTKTSVKFEKAIVVVSVVVEAVVDIKVSERVQKNLFNFR